MNRTRTEDSDSRPWAQKKKRISPSFGMILQRHPSALAALERGTTNRFRQQPLVPGHVGRHGTGEPNSNLV